MKYACIATSLLFLTVGVAGELPGTYTATYRVTFDATWSAETHPDDFPQNAHFSALIGAVHGKDVELWRVGTEASMGIELMAESGSIQALRREMDVLRDEGYVITEIGAPAIDTPGTTSFDIVVDRDHPYVTLISMIAPSPDWFVGISAMPTLSLAQWVPEITVFLSAYDAGTDSGVTYSAFDAETFPRQPIMNKIDGPFADQPLLGTFRFELLGTAGAFPIGSNMSGLYYSADRPGEGISVSVAETNNGPTIALTWYTYVDGQQLWLVGSATLAPGQDEVTIEVFETAGGQFGDAFFPEDVVLESWGNVTLRFPNCNAVEFAYDGVDGTGQLILERLVAGPICSPLPR